MIDLSDRELRRLLTANREALFAVAEKAIPALAQEVIKLRTQVTHWQSNHESVVKKKRKGHEITTDLIAELRRDVEKAHERIAELEELLGLR